MKSFGEGFKITNDVYQPLPPKIFKRNKRGNPYIHLATVHRGLKEYCAYSDLDENKDLEEIKKLSGLK